MEEIPIHPSWLLTLGFILTLGSVDGGKEREKRDVREKKEISFAKKVWSGVPAGPHVNHPSPQPITLLQFN